MRSPEEVRSDFVRQWTRKAAADLAAAELLERQGEPFLDLVCFHAQQAAEKFLKAILVHHQVDFRKSHDLDRILDLVGTVSPDLAESLREAGKLSRYGVEVRYPTTASAATREEAGSAIAVARRVRDAAIVALGIDPRN